MAGLDLADQELIDDAIGLVRDADTGSVLAGLPVQLSQQQTAWIGSHCGFSHAAVLVCPASVAGLVAGLRARGLEVDEPVPSVVVRERLSRRHGLPPGALEVGIVHVHVPAPRGGGLVEVFAVEVPPGLTEIAQRERREGNESHLALEVGAPDEVVVAGLCALLGGAGGMAADGGGYNALEDCTVLYFRTTNGDGSGPPRRLELRVRGRCAAALADHQQATTGDPARELLELMTGAWTTQAIAVAAELGLADHLPGPGTPGASPGTPAAPPPVTELAGRVGADPDALARLLRFLASAGLVAPAGDSYTLTPLGEPLRRDARFSLRPLALIYGGSFYQSFAALAHAVRTGQQGFEHHFGQGHFDYFAQRPALAELFDSAMAASAPMFDPVPALIDFSGVHVVADIAGGNGELLGRILRHAPHLRGILFERPHVLQRARQHLADTGAADRCDLVSGDFTQAIPEGADIYILSRILHDWDDQQCAVILRRCAASMRQGARLLMIERLLPTDTSDTTPSLAVPWDLHMLCNVGGRERTAGHYQQLLQTAGFTLETITPLPLDGNLLQARCTAPASPA